MKTIQCRTHEGGTFTIESRRGRPPVRCSEENPCSAAPTARRVAQSQRAVKVARATRRTPIEREADAKAQRDAEALKAAARRAVSSAAPIKAPEVAAKPRTRPDDTLSMAQVAKEHLEAQGWAVQGRAWTTDPRESYVIGTRTFSGGKFKIVEVTASRGEELITLVWQGGELIQQSYSLWDATKPSRNGKPKSNVFGDLDMDEMSDTELVRRLSGMPVTWWNRLGRIEEHGIIPDKVTITHTFNGTGDEVPGERLISFVDHGGMGFRQFRVDALMSVGK